MYIYPLILYKKTADHNTGSHGVSNFKSILTNSLYITFSHSISVEFGVYNIFSLNFFFSQSNL